MAEYIGDTTGKRLARVLLWQGVAMKLHPRFYESTFMYLASREGGDASVLKGLGVSEKNQLAVDRDSEALAHFVCMYPEVPIHRGLSTSVDRKFNFVFLDFCSNVCESTIGAIVHAAAKQVLKGGLLAWTYQRGRERKSEFEKILEHRHGEATNWRACSIISGNYADEGRWNDGRNRTILVEANIRLRKFRKELVPHSAFLYQSTVPMAVVCVTVDDMPKTFSPQMAKNMRYWDMKRKIRDLNESCDERAAEGQKYIDLIDHDDYDLLIAAENLKANWGMTHERTAMILNLSPEKLAEIEHGRARR